MSALAPQNFGSVLVMAGGTGGHVFPALSIARELQSKGYRVEWLGTESGLEAKVLDGTDIPLHCIQARGLRGKGLVSLLLAPFMVLRAVVEAVAVIKAVGPCCVLGMGGYVTGPGGVAAKLMGKPLLIHEQNAVAGFTNRLLSRIAVRVMEAFPGTFEASSKVLCTGNPVRKEISAIGENARETRSADALRVLVIGGSLGAVAINQLVPAALAESRTCEEVEIWHQAGNRNLEQTLEAYRKHGLSVGERIRVAPFIDDMAQAYRWADLVICRAGAMTVSELAAAGKASILVPFPHAVDDHQTSNAKSLSESGAAILVQQNELDKTKLASLLDDFRKNRDQLYAMGEKAREQAKLEASELVSSKCIEACRCE
ncbi:MAG: undecaprenyldiphospho-muramoylpentapeptide beta-N-acetylglucosaminyltransferase [Pseudohongiellaceae bacterium]|nr:undecaprenyldiphospho-muramoylpentapeptide beta-N-acetylglucosaminyltransferase [Pseudohongiellaceae bacterium]